MLCNNCGCKTATFHKTSIRNGIKTEVHLCSSCAQKIGAGLEIETEIFKSLNIGEFFGEVLSTNQKLPIIKKCEVCGTKITDFHKTAMLGCANCYKVFKNDIARMIDAAHGHGAVHKGKRAGVNGK